MLKNSVCLIFKIFKIQRYFDITINIRLLLYAFLLTYTKSNLYTYLKTFTTFQESRLNENYTRRV